MLIIDMWYGNKKSEITKFTCSFNDLSCDYRGNLFIGDKIVGDFYAATLQEVQRAFGRKAKNKNT